MKAQVIKNQLKYKAELVNVEGCVFDVAESNSKARLKKWARGRSGSYRVVLSIMVGSDRVVI